MKKAVILVRTSSENINANELSNSKQLELLRAYAKQNNIEIVKEFEEIGLASKHNRPIFKELFSFINKNEIKDI